MSQQTRKVEPITVPGWIFEERQQGQYFLLSVDRFGVVNIDGGHSSPTGVSKAKEVIQRLGLGEKERIWVMLKVDSVPEFKGKLNDGAIATIRNAREERYRG